MIDMPQVYGLSGCCQLNSIQGDFFLCASRRFCYPVDMARYSRAEQETIIRWDEDEQLLDIYTASERVAVRLMRRGYALQPLSTPEHGWRVRGVPISALTFRRQGEDVSGRPKKRVNAGLKIQHQRKRAQREKDAAETES